MTETSKTSEMVSTMLRSRCEKYAGTTPDFSEGNNNNVGQIRPIVSECCIIDTNPMVLCTEVINENSSLTFISTKLEDPKEC